MYKSCIVLFLISFTFAYAGEGRLPQTQKVNTYIQFSDDLDLKNMSLAIKRHMEYFNRAQMNITFKLGDETYSRSHLKQTLMAFDKLVYKTLNCLKKENKKICYDKLSKKINDNFHIYRPVALNWESGYKENKTLFTAYYSPDFHGSKVKTDVYKNPIYKLPNNSKLRRLTREQIDFDKKLADKGLEIVYVKESLYDIWLLHVEGGGRVQVKMADGSIENMYLSYAGSNKRSFRFLYKYMIDQGMLEPTKASISNQRKYLEQNPQDEREVLSYCPSYIFFKASKQEPLGVRNIILTENRSLASDYRRYKEYGILNFIKAKRPKKTDGRVRFRPFSRFFINQDTGGAIKGNARSDLYFGFGPEAELTANNLKVLGEQYFLIKKN